MDGVTIFLICMVILGFLSPTIKLIYYLSEFIRGLCVIKAIDLKEKYGDWAVITGSTDGIGKEYAKQLAKRNLNLILISRNLQKLNDTKSEIEAIYPAVRTEVLQADFSKGKDELKNVEMKLSDFPIGILVNNVGKLTDYPMYFEEIPIDVLWDMININIGATTIMTSIIIKQMKNRGKGAIVNISSASSFMPTPLMSVYSASKIYVRYLSDAIREECASHGLTVQCLLPYFINTKMIDYNLLLKKHKITCPDAVTYVDHAIKTLGKLNSCSGYWAHDIQIFLTCLFPQWLVIKMAFIVNCFGREKYIAYLKKINGR